MAGTKISDLPSASTLTGAELVPVVQSDVTKKTTVADILTSSGAGTVTSVNVSGGTTGLTATGGPITTSGTITLAGTLDVDNGGTGATTAANARSNLGAAASGANSDITSLTGVTGGISTPDFIQYDTAAGATTAVGKEYWNDNAGGLAYGMKGGNVTQNIGQQVYQRVYNDTGSTIAKGSVVYVTGSSGTRTTIAKAIATSDGTSASVIGVTAEAISNNSEGFVITEGEISGVNTSGIGDGEVLWLSPTVAGAYTDVKTTAPNHLVLVGYCVKGGSSGGGIIYVKMENGYEIGELHDVYVSSPANGQTLIYNATNTRWENHNLTAGSGISITNGAGSVTIAATGGSGTVTSVNVSGASTGLTFTGGPVTSSGTITMGGTLAVTYGGTGATTAANARINLLPSYTGNGGKVLAVNSGATDTEWISVGGTGTVTSVAVSGGSTGLTTSGGPITGAGTITLAGTLGVGYGGTGQTSYTDGQLLIGNSTGNTLTKSTLTAGSGISITNGSGSITIAATGGGGGSGTVTSVDVSGGTTGLSFTGGPVTSSGTITAGGTLAIANGGTGATDAATARANLGAGTGNGTVTSVGGTGTVNGITLTGTVTSSGSLTLGGTLSGVNLGSQVTGTLPVANGGTGLTSGTSGGVLYYSATGTLASSGALTANALVIGGGAGVAPSTITTGTGVVTALGVNTGSAGAFVVNGGALGTPSSGTLTNATGLPVSTGISGFGTGVATALAVNTGTAGAVVVNGGALGTPSSGTLTNATGLPLSTGVTGTLPVGNGGTGATTLTGIVKGNGTSAFTAATAGTDYVAPATATTFTATQTFTGSSSTLAAAFANAAETTTVSATAATGTINYDVTTQSVLYYTSNASANWTVNFRGSSGTSLNTLLSTGQSITVVFLVTQGSTAYYNNAVQIDGSSVTPKYQGGTAWSSGNASGIDAYSYTIVKTGSATFTVFASQTQFK